MAEAYNNSNSSNPESLSNAVNNNQCQEEKYNNNLTIENSCQNNINAEESEGSSNLTMNWQKVAHKLREYNRKLLKKVFRIEQELSDINDKLKQQLEKSRTSDILVAQQESEIKKYQEQIEFFERQLATFQDTIDQKEITIDTLSEQYELAQQQGAKLERQCTLLKENCDRQTYELTTKDEELQKLQTKLEKQQRLAIQYKAELQRDRQTKTTIPQKSGISQHNYNPKKIEPWSNPHNSDSTISLPQTKPLPLAGKKVSSSETIKTAAQIATWTASKVNKPLMPQNKEKAEVTSKSPVKVKPKSLAAIDLPTFPRKL